MYTKSSCELVATRVFSLFLSFFLLTFVRLLYYIILHRKLFLFAAFFHFAFFYCIQIQITEQMNSPESFRRVYNSENSSYNIVKRQNLHQVRRRRKKHNNKNRETTTRTKTFI